MSRLIAFLVSAVLVATLDTAPAQPAKKMLVLQSALEATITTEQPLRSLAFSPDGKMLAVGAENVHLFDVSAKAVTPTGTVIPSNPPMGKTSVHALAFSPNGKFLLFGSGDNSVRVWEVAAKAEAWQAKVHQKRITAVAFAPDGKTAATGGNDRTTVVWNVFTDGRLAEAAVIRDDQRDQGVRGLAFIPGKGSLVVAGDSGSFRTYTLGKDAPKAAGGFAPKGSLGAGAVAPNPGVTQWAVSSGSTVYVVSSTGTPVATLGGAAGHKGRVLDVAFAPDGKLLASCGADGEVIVWEVAGTKSSAKYSKSRPGEFAAVAFSPKAEEGTGDVTMAAGLEGGIIHVMKLGFR